MAIDGAPVARAAFPGSVGEASGERVDPLAQPAATRTMETNRQASCGVRLGIDVSRGVMAVVSEQMMESASIRPVRREARTLTRLARFARAGRRGSVSYTHLRA